MGRKIQSEVAEIFHFNILRSSSTEMCLPLEVVFISTNIQSWFGPLGISLDFEEDRIIGC
jgi:hypothetical protein